MVRSAPGWKVSEIASSRGINRCLAAPTPVLFAGIILDAVASGLQNGLWRPQSCKKNERHYLRYEKGNAPLSGKFLNSSVV